MLLGFLFIIGLVVIGIPAIGLVLFAAFTQTAVGKVFADAFNYITSFGLGIILVGLIWLAFIVIQVAIMFALLCWIGGNHRNRVLATLVSAVAVFPVPFLTWGWVLPYEMCAPAAWVEYAVSLLLMVALIADQSKMGTTGGNVR